ncbi:uncharacterized protein F5Z01DRAFT_743372 [Emericellopsis atlantica]|uniref:NB-ARC domain-containing protein n=1 Tax=Emericellopsis atlantica TaxID=2614577 RepID=A0A9P7ZKV4_9HYPO|nr:uncharacterized protein F5Z01DRAFT_743372 [Emericellopsis atlantica]KAG9253974.1 hypothetical protein F5Z01DRAFT_743372 [Emericellopsis atlantica]
MADAGKSTASVAGEPEPGSNSSPIWKAALERYFAETRRGGINEAAIENDLWVVQTPEELLSRIETTVPCDTQSSATWSRALADLKPVLLGLSDFAALIAWALGLDSKYALPVLAELVEMLSELQRTLPRIQKYEKELPMTSTLEGALLDMYSEIIVFCAYAVTFFRNNPNIGRSPSAWSRFNQDFAQTKRNLERYSRRVDEVADMIRLSRESTTAATVATIRNTKLPEELPAINLPCHSVPHGLNLRFFGRDDAIDVLRETLSPEQDRHEMRAIAMHGIGGVGKTQLALQYANKSLGMYEIIIWVPSESQIKFTQALSAFKIKLGLIDDKEQRDGSHAIQRLKDWLNTSNKDFLMIFDNVNDTRILDQIWPATPRASVIITTRSPSVASRRANKSFRLESFGLESGAEAIYALSGKQPSGEDDKAAALELCRLLGGLPLALAQVASFIADRDFSFSESMVLFNQSAEKVFARSPILDEYQHTVTTVWNLSLEQLSPQARIMHNLLAFFDPDHIAESLISKTKTRFNDPAWEFILDDFEFSDAVAELTRSSLITRLSPSKALSMHRLVQQTVFARLLADEKLLYLDRVIEILSSAFPNTWNRRGPYQGHGYETWETCGAVLPHISRLIGLVSDHGLRPSNAGLWAELVFRAGTYLWEKDQPYLAQVFLEFGLRIDIGESHPVSAQAQRILGHICLDIAQPHAALSAYSKTLSLRLMTEKADSPPIADIYDSIACSYTEIRNMPKAFEYVERTTAIHLAHDPAHMARTEAIRAMAFLRDNRPSEALCALHKCWELQNLSQEDVESSRYPKHSGDIMLLARILWALGQRSTGRELASRAVDASSRPVDIRRDSMFHLALMLNEEEEQLLSAKLLRDITKIDSSVQETKPHQARAFWFLAKFEEQIGTPRNLCDEIKSNAKRIKDALKQSEAGQDNSDKAYMSLVGWMLW